MSTNYGPNQPGQWQPQQPFPPQQQGWQGQPFPQQQWQGPPQGFPPPMMQQPPPQKKKSRTGCIVISSVVLLIVIAACSVLTQVGAKHATQTIDTANIVATSASTPVFSSPVPMPTYPPTPTPKPTLAPSWHTLQSFSGNGAKKTGTFSVPGDWRIQWKCTPDPTIGQGLLYIGVYNSDGTIVDTNAVGTNCKAGNTSGNTEEHQSGQVYLDINSGIDWSVTVETLQ